jgi:hypothetical protein
LRTLFPSHNGSYIIRPSEASRPIEVAPLADCGSPHHFDGLERPEDHTDGDCACGYTQPPVLISHLILGARVRVTPPHDAIIFGIVAITIPNMVFVTNDGQIRHVHVIGIDRDDLAPRVHVPWEWVNLLHGGRTKFINTVMDDLTSGD